jgi:hypothetical protein
MIEYICSYADKPISSTVMGKNFFIEYWTSNIRELDMKSNIREFDMKSNIREFDMKSTTGIREFGVKSKAALKNTKVHVRTSKLANDAKKCIKFSRDYFLLV